MMKKLLGIVVLGLVWCNVGLAKLEALETYRPRDKVLIKFETDWEYWEFC